MRFLFAQSHLLKLVTLSESSQVSWWSSCTFTLWRNPALGRFTRVLIFLACLDDGFNTWICSGLWKPLCILTYTFPSCMRRVALKRVIYAAILGHVSFTITLKKINFTLFFLKSRLYWPWLIYDGNKSIKHSSWWILYVGNVNLPVVIICFVWLFFLKWY